MNELFIERLRQAIKTTGLRQKEFAANSGISAGYLTDILKGRTEPSDRVIRDICLGNKLSEDWLRDGSGDMVVAQGITDTLDPELAKAVIAERQDRHGSTEPMTLTTTEAEVIELLRDLPEDARLDEYDNIRALWLSLCRGKNPPI